MVLFGALVINHDHFNISHAGVSGSDDAMNYGCGTCFLLLLLLSLTLSPFLYYYHWQHRVSWTARFYRFLAFLSCTATLFGSLPMAVYLLMPGYLPKGSGFLSYLNKFFFLLVDFSWVSQLSVVFMLSAMQWVYIHRPLWSLVYGTKLKRVGLTITICFGFSCLSTFGFLLFDKHASYFGWLEQVQIAFAQNGTGSLLMLLLVYLPQLLLVLLSLSIFLVTCAMLLQGQLTVAGTMRRDLLTIGLLVGGGAVWAALKIANTAVLWPGDTSYAQLYLWFVTNNLAPALLAGYNSLVIAACDGQVRQVMGRFLRSGRLQDAGYGELE